MLADLAALTPPLVVAGVFLIGLILFLRRQMGSAREERQDHDGSDIPDDGRNVAHDEPAQPSSPDTRKV
jgi:Flp pilus assembly protein TadB